MNPTQADIVEDVQKELDGANGEEPIEKHLVGVTPWPSPSLTHSMWLTELERFLLLNPLVQDLPKDDKDARERREVHDILIRGLSDEEAEWVFERSWSDEKGKNTKVDIKWTKAAMKACQRLLKEKVDGKLPREREAVRWNTRQTWYVQDVLDRIGFVLTGNR